MRTLVRLAMITPLVLIPACSQVTPTASPESTPLLSPTATKEATSTPQPSATPTPTSTFIPTPSPTSQPTATPTPEPTVYVTTQRCASYSGLGGEATGYIILGKSFVILEEQDGWTRIRLEGGAEAWIQASETAYRPEGEPAPATATPTTLEYEPSNEICDVEGRCYQRTRRRTGIVLNPDGTERPMGVGFCYRHTADPDRNFQGTWGVNGRIAQITNASRGEFRMNIGRDGETLLINVRMMHEQPDNRKNYQYARMRTFQYGVDWRISTPEVRPRLGRDLIVGDYLEIGPYGICRNNFTKEENYQRVAAAGTSGTIFTYRLEMVQ